jgi:fumarate hydratase class I
MTVIRQQDFIDSIEDSLQFISYYHPLDYIKAVEKAYNKEQSQAAKDAMAQILINSRMSAEGKRPLCQDTGIVTCFVKIGMDVQWDKTDLTVQQMVDEGTRRAYLNPRQLSPILLVNELILKTIRQQWCISILYPVAKLKS